MKKIVGFLTFIALIVGCGVLLLFPDNSVLWQTAWGLAIFFAVLFIVLNWQNFVHFFLHRTTRYGMNLGLIGLMSLGIVASVNYIGANYSKRFDLTASHKFTLSP